MSQSPLSKNIDAIAEERFVDGYRKLAAANNPYYVVVTRSDTSEVCGELRPAPSANELEMEVVKAFGPGRYRWCLKRGARFVTNGQLEVVGQVKKRPSQRLQVKTRQQVKAEAAKAKTRRRA